MALWKDSNNQIHDDMGGTALNLLPQKCIEITDKEADSIRQASVIPPTYQQLRAAKYPSIQDQLDMQYHDSVNGTTTWKDSIGAVKAEIPKP